MELSRALVVVVLVAGCHVLLPLDPPMDPKSDGPLADQSTGDRLVLGDGDDCPWTHRRKLSFNTVIQPQPLVGFQVLVSLDPTGFNYARTRVDGSDLRFTNPDNVPVVHEIEQWSPGGRSAIWVRAMRIDPGSDHLWLYYGKADPSQQQDPSGVWEGGFKAVWHMNATAAGGVRDSTTAGHHLSGQGGISLKNQLPGIMGGAMTLEKDQHLVSTLDEVPKEYTLEAVFKLVDHSTFWEHHLVELKGTQFMVDENRKLEAGTSDEFEAAENKCKTAVELDKWHYAVFVQAQNGWSLYLDGKNEAKGPEVTSPEPKVFVGEIYSWPAYFDNTRLRGSIDEVRVSDLPRSAGWIAAQHASMNGGFVTLSPEEPTSPAACPKW